MKKAFLLPLVLALTTATTRASVQDSSFAESPIVLHTASGDIYGTLTVPKTAGKLPVALIIAGSGPTDRNGDNPVMKNASLQKLAYALADNRIASVRFDKRAIAASAGASKSEADLRFEDYINDAKGWIDLLKKDGRFSKLIVIGHSEGSLIGMVAALNKADGFISIAGAGKPADKIIRQQLASQPQQIRDLTDPIIDSLVSGRTVANVPGVLYSLFRPSVQPYMISWFRYDPAIEIHKLSIPVLIIQGTNDIQVSLDDAKLLKAANPVAELVTIDRMNHIFRIVEGDRNQNIATYSNPALPISDVLIQSVSGFIKKLN